MFQMYEYDEIKHQLTSISVKEDDRSIQAKCFAPLHQFAVNSNECVCGKYGDYAKLINSPKTKEVKKFVKS